MSMFDTDKLPLIPAPSPFEYALQSSHGVLSRLIWQDEEHRLIFRLSHTANKEEASPRPDTIAVIHFREGHIIARLAPYQKDSNSSFENTTLLAAFKGQKEEEGDIPCPCESLDDYEDIHQITVSLLTTAALTPPGQPIPADSLPANSVLAQILNYQPHMTDTEFEHSTPIPARQLEFDHKTIYGLGINANDLPLYCSRPEGSTGVNIHKTNKDGDLKRIAYFTSKKVAATCLQFHGLISPNDPLSLTEEGLTPIPLYDPLQINPTIFLENTIKDFLDHGPIERFLNDNSHLTDRIKTTGLITDIDKEQATLTIEEFSKSGYRRYIEPSPGRTFILHANTQDSREVLHDPSMTPGNVVDFSIAIPSTRLPRIPYNPKDGLTYHVNLDPSEIKELTNISTDATRDSLLGPVFVNQRSDPSFSPEPKASKYFDTLHRAIILGSRNNNFQEAGEFADLYFQGALQNPSNRSQGDISTLSNKIDCAHIKQNWTQYPDGPDTFMAWHCGAYKGLDPGKPGEEIPPPIQAIKGIITDTKSIHTDPTLQHPLGPNAQQLTFISETIDQAQEGAAARLMIDIPNFKQLLQYVNSQEENIHGATLLASGIRPMDNIPVHRFQTISATCENTFSVRLQSKTSVEPITIDLKFPFEEKTQTSQKQTQ